MKNVIQHFIRVGIIADDLTSAADGAAPFRQRGLSVTVMRGAADPPQSPSDVWSVDCASRSLDEEAAAKVTAKGARALENASLLYKTIDSTLRGHIKTEINAAFHASGRKHLVVAPAFPEAGRITSGGVQYVNGVRVCRSPYANDRVHPAKTSRIADLVPAGISDVTILDAETQQELNRKVTSIENAEDTLWVGSPGLAIALANRFAQGPVDQHITPICKSILLAVGSANQVSRRQLARVASHPNVRYVKTAENWVASPTQELSKLVERILYYVKDSDALIATGGDTMEAILRQLDIRQFILAGELEPGFPLGIAVLKEGRSFTIGMKAGGFGDDETLLRAVNALCSGNKKVI